MIVRVHAIEPRSRANGPGARFVVWLQGCSLGCAGCFNPTTHDAGGGSDTTVDDVLARLRATRDIEGLTLSGGEPFQQPAAAAALLAGAREIGLSTLVFSGYRRDEIDPALLADVDVLIDGRYEAPVRLGAGLRGSENQRIHLVTSRYTVPEIEATPVAEVRIGPGGEVVLTGVDPLKLKG